MKSPRSSRGQIFRASAGCDRGTQACAHARSRGRLLLFAVLRLAGGTLPFWSNALSAGNGARHDSHCKKRASCKSSRSCSPPKNWVYRDPPHNEGNINSVNKNVGKDRKWAKNEN